MITFARRILHTCFAVLILALLAKVGSANEAMIGNVVSADQELFGSHSGQLFAGSPVHQNELIRSNESGLGQIVFVDGTKMVIGHGATISLDSLIYDENSGSLTDFTLTAASGAIRFISGSGNSSAYRIKTPVGTLGLRGTAFDIGVLGTRTYVMLVNGQVEFCSTSGQCTVLDKKCGYLVADAGGNVSEQMQPQTGQFNYNDRKRFFPFIASQRRLHPQFALLQGCRGSSRGQHGGGSPGNGNGGSGGTGGGGQGGNGTGGGSPGGTN